MGSYSERAKQLEVARVVKTTLHEPNEHSEVYINAKRLAFSILVTGESYSAIAEVLMWNDIPFHVSALIEGCKSKCSI